MMDGAATPEPEVQSRRTRVQRGKSRQGCVECKTRHVGLTATVGRYAEMGASADRHFSASAISRTRRAGTAAVEV